MPPPTQPPPPTPTPPPPPPTTTPPFTPSFVPSLHSTSTFQTLPFFPSSSSRDDGLLLLKGSKKKKWKRKKLLKSFPLSTTTTTTTINTTINTINNNNNKPLQHTHLLFNGHVKGSLLLKKKATGLATWNTITSSLNKANNHASSFSKGLSFSSNRFLYLGGSHSKKRLKGTKAKWKKWKGKGDIETLIKKGLFGPSSLAFHSSRFSFSTNAFLIPSLSTTTTSTSSSTPLHSIAEHLDLGVTQPSMFPSFSSLDPSVSSFFPSERGISSSWHSSSYLDLPPSDFFPFHGSFLPIPPEAACAIVTSSTPLLSPSSMDFNASSTRFAVPTLITTSSSLSPSPSPSLPTLSTGPPAPPPPPFSLSSSFFSSSSDSNTLSLPRPTPPLSDQSPHVLLPTHRRFSSTSSSIQPIPYVTLQRTWSCRSTHPLFSSTEIMDDVHPNAASHGNLWKPRSFLATPPLLTTGLSSIPPRLRRFSLPILPPSSMTPPILRVDPFPSSATFLLRHPRVSSSTVSSSSSSSSSMPPALLSSSPPSSSSLPWSFPSPYRRATYLVCLAMSLTGSFYAFDLPAQLNRALASHFHVPQELWPVPFARLYVVYAFPNMVMPLLSGYAVERWGPRPVLMGLTLLVVVGQSLVTYGLHQRGYLWMLLGRGVLGLGGESLSVAQTSLTYVWFHDSELGFALGFHLGMARLGSVLNDVCTAVIEQTFGIMRAAWVAWVACMVSAGFGGMACYLDTVREKRGLASWGKKDVNVSRGGVEERVPLLKPLESFSLEKGLDIHPSWKSGSEMNVTSRSNPPPLTTTSSTRFFALVYQGLNRKFWALALAMVSVYAAPNTFSSVGSDFLQGKYQFTASQAGFLLALSDTFATFVVPLTGWLFEKLDPSARRHVLLINFATVGGLFFTLAFTSTPLLVPFVFIALGTTYAVGASMLWPMIPCLVHDRRILAFAYGLVTCFVNLSLTVIPNFIALQIAADPSYTNGLFSLALLGLFGGLCILGCT